MPFFEAVSLKNVDNLFVVEAPKFVTKRKLVWLKSLISPLFSIILNEKVRYLKSVN